MVTRIVVDAHLSRDGMYQYMQMYTDNGYVQLSGTSESYLRAAIMMGIHEIAIYVNYDNRGIDMKLARQMKQDMLDCYALDHVLLLYRSATVMENGSIILVLAYKYLNLLSRNTSQVLLLIRYTLLFHLTIIYT